jgi:hypothetical protein
VTTGESRRPTPAAASAATREVEQRHRARDISQRLITPLAANYSEIMQCLDASKARLAFANRSLRWRSR